MRISQRLQNFEELRCILVVDMITSWNCLPYSFIILALKLLKAERKTVLSMSSSWKLLSKIDKKTKYCVYGWVREMEKELKIQHVPMMISGITILYFRDDEIFNAVTKNVKLSNNNKCITKCGDTGNVIGVGYGIIEVPSMSDMKYKWSFQINKSENSHVVIGIIDSKKNINDNDYPVFGVYLITDNDIMKSDGVRCFTGTGARYTNNDIFSLILDLQNMKVDICINDKEQDIAFDNITKGIDIKYRLFVALLQHSESVEIIIDNFTKY